MKTDLQGGPDPSHPMGTKPFHHHRSGAIIFGSNSVEKHLLPTSAATHLELLACGEVAGHVADYGALPATHSRSSYSCRTASRSAQLLELSVTRNPFLGDGCAPIVHVATTALHIDGVIRSAVPTAKAAASELHGEARR
jgi:hypothetical protein